MTTIQLRLPDELAGKVQSLTNNAEAYIIDLLRAKINELSLADEYRMSSVESTKLMEEFVHVDAEGWDEY
jgi:hypothetical protein